MTQTDIATCMFLIYFVLNVYIDILLTYTGTLFKLCTTDNYRKHVGHRAEFLICKILRYRIQILRMIQFNVRNSISGMFMNPIIRKVAKHNYFR